MESNIERLLNALINGESIDIDPQTNVEHFLKECVDEVCCGHCPEPKSRMDILLIELRDKLINGSGSGKTEQEKSVNITSNGTTEVLPDENKTLSKVTVNTNVVATSKLPQLIDGSITTLTAEDLVGVTAIKSYCFSFSSLSSIEIPEGVEAISANCFNSCHSLTYVKLPNSLKILKSRAFTSCRSLTNIELPSNLEEIEQEAFNYCSSLISIEIPANCSKIASGAFRNCANLTTAIINSDLLLQMPPYMFHYDKSLTNFTIPEQITKINSGCFTYCESLVELTIPSNVNSIGDSALRIGTETNKATIIMKPTTPPSIQSNTISSTTLNKIIVPTGCADAYKSATNWASYADYIEEEGA